MPQAQALIFMKKRKQGTRPARSARARTRPPAAGVFALSAECTVAQSAALKSGLQSLLARSAPITLDVAALQRIDTAGMQLIAAFVRERESRGRQVKWRGAAPALISAARLLGLAPALSLPEPAQ